eukprot:13420575-Ditylum_brightwellii.AAC.1
MNGSPSTHTVEPLAPTSSVMCQTTARHGFTGMVSPTSLHYTTCARNSESHTTVTKGATSPCISPNVKCGFMRGSPD